LIIRDLIAEIIEKSLTRAVSDKEIDAIDYPKIKVEFTKEEKYGDYATPFALESARLLRKSPIDIGNILKGYIQESKIVDRVDVVKPGFINLFLSLDFLNKTLLTILDMRDSYGRTVRETPARVNLEFVSANPTGPLNIVSARAAALGDTIANLLEADGYEVYREFYINDFGNQVYLLGKSVLYRYRELSGEEIAFPEDAYHGEYIKDIAIYIKESFKGEIEKCSDEEELIDFIASKAVEYNVSKQKKDLADFNVEFDTWFSERSLHENGYIESVLKHLESINVIKSEDGKKLFKSKEFGDDKDRVLVRDDQRPTYFLADIAYHKNKIDRGFNLIINIWGPDHHGYMDRLKGAMKSLGFEDDSFKILIAQQVNLIKQGQTVKMSKRLGKFSTMSELIDEIGVDVARYFFIMRSMESHLDFDLALAKRESSENPVFYLQYAHARICSIFREAEKRGIVHNVALHDIGVLNNNESVALLKLMVKFPEEVHDSAISFEPHRIANYLLKLAQLFHKFYTEHRVLSDDEVTTSTYLSLCDGVRIVLKNGLNLLGVSAPEKM
jgi:arginyl-tRNA synthetase